MKRIILIILILILWNNCRNIKDNEWVIQDIFYQARDGLKIRTYLLKPKIVKKKYPAVLCVHHAWGNRDDYLKLFPILAETGIIALSPELIRHKPGFQKERYQDIIDSINYLENQPFIDNNNIGIITSSLSVNTGAIAINNKWNIKAFVILSGPIIMENQRKMITLNTDMAIFPVVSKYETNNYELIKEYIARSLNPNTRYFFIDNKEKKFKVEEHGTYLFDTHPEIISLIRKFLVDVFKINQFIKGKIINTIPDNTIEFKSIDGIPLYATFYHPNRKGVKTILFLPPRYKSRLYYEDVASKLKEFGIGMMMINNKRTCRYFEKEYLCDREIKGALQYLVKEKKIKEKEIIMVVPSAYFIAIEKLLKEKVINVKNIILIGKPDPNAYLEPEVLKDKFSNVIYIKIFNKNNLIKILMEITK